MKSAALPFLLLVHCLCAVPAEPNPFPDLPPTEPEGAFATFDMHPDFKLELLASEPLIADPVAMSFDENGALYVVEMRGYSERRDEKLGRVKRLEDRNHDGRMDHATVFAEGLAWPTGVLCHDGGVFVLAAPDLWYFKDTRGDGIADEKRVVLTGFSEQASRVNVQQLPNNVRWGIDQRIHIAEGGNGSRIRRPNDTADKVLDLRGRDLVFDPRTLQFHAENGGGQFGMSFDDAGRKFVSSNSDHLQAILYDNIVTSPDSGVRARVDNTTTLHPPAAKRSISADGGAAPVYRLSPDEAWRVVRTRWRVSGQVGGPIEGGGRPSGYFTGATGIQIYRGDLFPDSFRGNAFIADVGSNLIHRKQLRADHQTFIGERAPAEQNREFLASTDNWFRPVQLENGPDGALYVLDFYRELIEHPWSLPPGIKEHLDLNRGNDRGRIWRVVPKNIEPRRKIDLGSKSTLELVKFLEHPNGWHRDTASRLLVERDDPTVIELLHNRRSNSTSTLARVHALAILNKLGELDIGDLRAALSDENSDVREHAVRVAADRLTQEELFGNDLLADWLRLAEDPSPGVRWQVLVALTGHPSQQLFETLLKGSKEFIGARDALPYFAFGLVPQFDPNTYSKNLYEDYPAFMTTLIRVSASQADAARITNWLSSNTNSAVPNVEDLNFKLLAIVAGLTPPSVKLANWVMPESVQKEATRQARMAINDHSTRQLGFSVLKNLPSTESDELLVALMPSNDDLQFQSQIISHVTSRSSKEMFNALLDALPELAPENQNLLLRLSAGSTPQREWLFSRLESEPELRVRLSVTFKNTLRKNRDEKVRAWAEQHLEPTSDASTEQRIQKYQPAIRIAGDARHGKEIFQLRCAICHRAGDEGPEIGPDLVTVARAGRPAMLSNIVDPNREINSNYETWRVVLKDGNDYTGKQHYQSDNSFALQLADGSHISINRYNVSSLRPTGRSLMPEGLDEGMSVEDMADLLRFIEELAIRNIETFAE